MPTLRIKWWELFWFKRVGLLILLIFFCLIVSSVLGWLTPQLMKNLSAHYDQPDYIDKVQSLGLLFIAVYFNRMTYQLGINSYVRELMQNIRVQCYQYWLVSIDGLSRDQRKKDSYPQGEVMARIMSDTEAIRELVTSGTFGIFIDLFFIISCLISFVQMDTVAGVGLSLFEVVIVLFLVWGSRYMREIYLQVRTARGNMAKIVANVVAGASQTYYTPHSQYASKKGRKVFDDFLHKQLIANIWDASYYSVAESVYPLLLMLMIFIFPYSKLTEGALVFALVDLIQRSIGPIKEISGKVANIQRAMSGLTRINEFLSDLSERPQVCLGHEFQDPSVVDSLTVKIDFFSYDKNNPEAFSLREIGLLAKRGELLGIVGQSGCGKSTLFQLLAANLVLESGEVKLKFENGSEGRWRGGELADINKYRQYVGLVSQESHIFSQTLQFNITLGHKENDFTQFWTWVTSEIEYLRLWQINPQAQLDPTELSMGQRQLIAALRACFLKKSLVLFDEVSSGLDSKLEAALSKVIRLVQKNSITLVIAHRIETVVESDAILLMENGRIAARGVHQDLMESSPLYQSYLQELAEV